MTWTTLGAHQPSTDWQVFSPTAILGGPVLIKVSHVYSTWPDCSLLLRQRFFDGVYGARQVWPSTTPKLLRFDVPPELEGTPYGVTWELEGRLWRIRRAPEAFSWQVTLELNYGAQ